MPPVVIEGFIESGTVRLRENISLPERTRVLVIVDGFAGPGTVPSTRIRSPRLAHPEQSRDFRKHIVEAPPDAGV